MRDKAESVLIAVAILTAFLFACRMTGCSIQFQAGFVQIPTIGAR